jgi:hypothetical protein
MEKAIHPSRQERTMKGRASTLAGGLFLVVTLTAAPSPGAAQEQSREGKTVRQDQVVAGSPQDFMEVRHLILRGSNEEIGKALGTIARERFHLEPTPSSDRLRTRVQRRYFEKNYPFLFERMSGVATAFGKRVDDDGWNFSGLWYLLGLGAGCSVVYYPPGLTASGTGIVSRNYDFSTGTLEGAVPPKGTLAATARPYVIEMHPTRGYASLAICSYDLLGGVMDGINSEGLTVSLLADDELFAKFAMEPAGFDGVGLGVAQVLRMLLDTCASADEAKEALLMTKQYYELVPVHYLIADRHGKAFVWEYSQAHNREYILENPNRPLVTTNFSLHRHLDGKNLPGAEKTREVCPRYCEMAERLAKREGKLTLDVIKENHRAIDLVQPSPAPGTRAPSRTLWHALYVPEKRQVQVSFYLRDEPNAGQPKKPRIVRTDYLEFTLADAKGVKD